MSLFNTSKARISYISTETGEKVYPVLVDVKKGVQGGEFIQFVSSDINTGILSVAFMLDNADYNVNGKDVVCTVQRPDTTTIELPCKHISNNVVEVHLGVNGTSQSGIYNFDFKIYRGNDEVVGTPILNYTVSQSICNDVVVEDDERLPVLTELMNQLSGLKSEATEVIEESREVIQDTVEATNNANSAVSKVSSAVSNMNNTVNTKISELESVKTNLTTTVTNKISEVDIAKSDMTNTVSNKISDVETRFNRLTSSQQQSSEIIDARDGEVSLKARLDRDIEKAKQTYVDVEGSIISTQSSEGYLKDVEIKGNTVQNASNLADIRSVGDKVEGQELYEISVVSYNGLDISDSNYQEDKLTILSPTPLEKVGDVADRIICKDGVWGVEKNVVDMLLNEANCTISMSNASDIHPNYAVFDFSVVDNKNYVKTSLLFCNKFNHLLYSTDRNSSDKEGCWIGNAVFFSVKILKSKLESTNVDGMKKWLKTNNLNFKYLTTQPEFIPLPHDQQIKLRTFAGQTNIHFKTEIEGTIKAQVPKSIGASINTHTEQIESLNNELNRVKKLEESTVSTVTTENNFTTVEETSNGYFEDVKLEGKTLVNLYEFKKISGVGGKWGYIELYNNLLDTTKIYTVILNGLPNGFRWKISQGEIDFSNYSFDTKNLIKFTLKDLAYYTIHINDSGVTNITEDLLNNIKVIILEGDHTQNPPSFFEGLKSVGDGVDEVSVESVNPNGNLFDGTLEVGSLNTSGDTNWISYVKTGLIRVKPSSEVICKIGKYKGENATSTDIRLAEYDINKNFINFRGGTYKATVSDKTHYVKVAKKLETSDSIRVDINAVSDVVVVYGNELHNIPHKSDKKPLLYYNPTTQTWEKPVLREWDTIEKHSDGKYYYHKRSGEVVLNGSENGWYHYANNINDNVIAFGNNRDDLTYSSMFPIVLCDKFGYIYAGYSKDVECISTYAEASGKAFYIVINKDKLNGEFNTKGFKAWLQANPTTVVYQLANEEVYECTNIDLITYDGETNYIVESGAISPRSILKVHNNISNVMRVLQEKVSILENKFIQGLKQVLAGDMYSLATLLYPEDFETENSIMLLPLE